MKILNSYNTEIELKRKRLKTTDRLIVSLDVSSRKEAIQLCKKIDNKVSTLKIGLELLYSVGLDAIRIVKSFGYKVLMDAKLHDIPNTVCMAAAAISRLNIEMITVHILGGSEMLKRAKNKVHLLSADKGRLPPLLFGVSILTSLDNMDLESFGFSDGYLSSVLKLAEVAINSSLDGIICSPNEVRLLREKYGNSFYIATPGIRLKEDSQRDQKRFNTPGKAILDGADIIIAGRSITKKDNVGETVDIFLEKIEKALKNDKSN